MVRHIQKRVNPIEGLCILPEKSLIVDINTIPPASSVVEEVLAGTGLLPTPFTAEMLKQKSLFFSILDRLYVLMEPSIPVIVTSPSTVPLQPLVI